MTLIGTFSSRITEYGRLKLAKNGWKTWTDATLEIPIPTFSLLHIALPIHVVIVWGTSRFKLTSPLELKHSGNTVKSTPSLSVGKMVLQADTVSLRAYAEFWAAHIPLFGPEVIFKSVITQCKSCLGIAHTTTFILMWLETLCTYTCEDTVYLPIMSYIGRKAFLVIWYRCWNALWEVNG